MNASVDVKVAERAGSWVATVRVVQGTARTEHHVTVTPADLERYGGPVADLVRRSFVFLLAREPSTSILRDFGIGDIERYFPDYREVVRSR